MLPMRRRQPPDALFAGDLPAVLSKGWKDFFNGVDA
jgi:hypothetical protein